MPKLKNTNRRHISSQLSQPKAARPTIAIVIEGKAYPLRTITDTMDYTVDRRGYIDKATSEMVVNVFDSTSVNLLFSAISRGIAQCVADLKPAFGFDARTAGSFKLAGEVDASPVIDWINGEKAKKCGPVNRPAWMIKQEIALVNQLFAAASQRGKRGAK